MSSVRVQTLCLVWNIIKKKNNKKNKNIVWWGDHVLGSGKRIAQQWLKEKSKRREVTRKWTTVSSTDQ